MNSNKMSLDHSSNTLSSTSKSSRATLCADKYCANASSKFSITKFQSLRALGFTRLSIRSKVHIFVVAAA